MQSLDSIPVSFNAAELTQQAGIEVGSDDAAEFADLLKCAAALSANDRDVLPCIQYLPLPLQFRNRAIARSICTCASRRR